MLLLKDECQTLGRPLVMVIKSSEPPSARARRGRRARCRGRRQVEESEAACDPSLAIAQQPDSDHAIIISSRSSSASEARLRRVIGGVLGKRCAGGWGRAADTDPSASSPPLPQLSFYCH